MLAVQALQYPSNSCNLGFIRASTRSRDHYNSLLFASICMGEGKRKIRRGYIARKEEEIAIIRINTPKELANARQRHGGGSLIYVYSTNSKPANEPSVFFGPQRQEKQCEKLY